MSHSVNQVQVYLELYKQHQASVASRLHSDLAQSVVAAKNFAAAIMSIQGEGEGLQEAQELAGVILEMTDQAYTVAYDLMRENEDDVAYDSSASIRSTIEHFGVVLRLSKRGIKLAVVENLSSISMDEFLQAILIDWLKTVLVYLARQGDGSIIAVKIGSSKVSLKVEIACDLELSLEMLETEMVLANIRKQLEILSGTLVVDRVSNQTVLRIEMPLNSSMLTVAK